MRAWHRAVVALVLTLMAATWHPVAAQPAQPPVPPEQAERTAQEVVDGLGFDEPADPEEPPAVPPGGSAFGAVGQVLAYLLVAAAAVGIAYAVILLVRGRGHRRDRGDAGDDESVDVETGDVEAGDEIDALTAAQWRARAAEAEAQGRFADAVRYLHFGGLIGLDEDGLVEFEPGRANGDYVRLVSTLTPGDVPADLGRLNRLMEDATFGSGESDAAALEWSRAGWERVRIGIGAAGAEES